MINVEAFQNSISKLLIHPLLWRLTGFASSIAGFCCYAISPSFHDMFGQWNALKIIVYGVVSSLLSIFKLFIKRCNWRRRESGKCTRQNDEPHLQWRICIDGYELVQTTPTWIRVLLLGWMFLGNSYEDEFEVSFTSSLVLLFACQHPFHF
ncbi:hypothetical protein glysoja_000080 [Glycine soja]|nr:hypothetical protein glysoja_000080 [Glycine soja]